jgi:NADH-quinone oxidoreductase subunit L
MFHVVTHAFFKACLFLGAGAVIYSMAHNQDMRNYGNLKKYLKITTWTMVVATLAIAGFPGLSGFWSKEAILGGALGNDLAQVNDFNVGVIAGYVALFAALLTAWYISRLAMLTFFGKEERWRQIDPRHDTHAHAHAHADHTEHAEHEGRHGEDVFDFYYTEEEVAQRAAAVPEEHHHSLDRNFEPKEAPPSMWWPLVILATLSAIGGWLMARGDVFHNWLYPGGKLAVLPEGMVKGEPSNIPLTQYSMVAALGGLLLGYIFYRNGLPKKEGWDLSKWNWFRKWAGNQFGYDNALVNSGVEGGGELGTGIWKVFDVGFVDGFVNGIGSVTMGAGRLLRKFQTGYVRSYAMSMAFGGILILAIVVGVFMAGGK